jgi:hypothetical protein
MDGSVSMTPITWTRRVYRAAPALPAAAAASQPPSPPPQPLQPAQHASVYGDLRLRDDMVIMRVCLGVLIIFNISLFGIVVDLHGQQRAIVNLANAMLSRQQR